MADRDRYHHGDLRRALVEAGLAILEEEGIAALTLRRVAARAGVSHAAPAHHFPTLKDLVTALATVAFERFGAAMAEGRRAAGPDPASDLRGALEGYVAFAHANPGLFRLMFAAERLNRADPALCTAASASRAQLTEICAPFVERKGLTAPDRMVFERAVWSIAHGYAHLAVEGQFGDAGEAVPDLTRYLNLDGKPAEP